MTSFNSAIASGFAYVQIGFLDSNGFFVGSSTSAPASGATGSGMTFVTGVKQASPNSGEPEYVQITGDGKLLGEFDYESLASRGFIIETSISNLTLDATLQGTNVVSFGDGKLGVMDIIDAAEINACLILQSRAKKYDTGSIGQKGWSGIIIPMAIVKPLGRASFEERGAAVYRYSVAPQVSDHTPWGLTILDSNFGTTGARYLPFNFENPITMHAHTGNASLQTWNLDRQPVSAAKTVLYSDRVALTVSSVSTSSPYSVTTSASAPITGAHLVTTYEFSA